jgi:hypothetical protein
MGARGKPVRGDSLPHGGRLRLGRGRSCGTPGKRHARPKGGSPGRRPTMIRAPGRAGPLAAGTLCILGLALPASGSPRPPERAIYYGTIGRTLEIEMELLRDGDSVAGSYRYASQRRPIRLRGTVTPESAYELAELDQDGRVTARFHLDGLLGPGHLDGHWWSGARDLVVTLEAITPELLRRLHAMWDGDPAIRALTAGDGYACAFREAGVWCWGMIPAFSGVATGGPEMIAYRALPHLRLPAGVSALAIGFTTSCAVRGGTLLCWQPRSPYLPLSEPTPIPGLSSGVTAAAVNERYACAVAAGALRCWTTRALDSTAVFTVFAGGVSQVAEGSPSCAVVGGRVLCWRATTDAAPPRVTVDTIAGLEGGIRSLAASEDGTFGYGCAVDLVGLKCWGDNLGGWLRRREIMSSVYQRAAPVAGLQQGVSEVSVAGSHACAVQMGRVDCWGESLHGELGGDVTGPTGSSVVDLPELAVHVAVAEGYSCALTEGNHVWCWGDNEFGQTGNRSRDVCDLPNGRIPEPIRVPCNRHPVRVRGLE